MKDFLRSVRDWIVVVWEHYTWLCIGIIVCLVAIIALVVLFIIESKKKKEKAKNAVEAKEDDLVKAEKTEIEAEETASVETNAKEEKNVEAEEDKEVVKTAKKSKVKTKKQPAKVEEKQPVNEDVAEEDASGEVKKVNNAKYRLIYDRENTSWVIRKDGAGRTIRRVKTKKEALSILKEMEEKNEDIKMVIHKKNGKFQKHK